MYEMAVVEVVVLAQTSFEHHRLVGKLTRKKVIENKHENHDRFEQHFDLNLVSESSEFSYQILQFR